MNAPAVTDLELEIKQILIGVSGLKKIQPTEIDRQASLFKGGLGLDSIDVLELVVRLEKRFGLKIRNNESGHALLQNVATIVAGVQTHLDQAARSKQV